MKGRYPSIFDNNTYGKEAKQLFEDANILLDSIIKENLLKARAVVGLFPANSIGDDIEIYSFENSKGEYVPDRGQVSHILHHLRQQSKAGSLSCHLHSWQSGAEP